MFFKVNFRYDEPYLPTPRCRKLRHREAQSSVEVDVPCIPKAQAHPVFRVSDYDMHQSGIVKNTIYQYNGKLWKVTLKDNLCCGAPHEPATAVELQDIFDRYHYHEQCGHLDPLEIESDRAAQHAEQYLLIIAEIIHKRKSMNQKVHAFLLPIYAGLEAFDYFDDEI